MCRSGKSIELRTRQFTHNSICLPAVDSWVPSVGMEDRYERQAFVSLRDAIRDPDLLQPLSMCDA